MELKKEFVKFEKVKGLYRLEKLKLKLNGDGETYDLDRHGRHLELDDTCLLIAKRDFLNNLIFSFLCVLPNNNERGSSCRSQFVFFQVCQSKNTKLSK